MIWKRILPAALAAALLLPAGCGPAPADPSGSPSGGEIPGDAGPAQTEDFALRSAALLLDPAENSCYSPVSLYLALSMAASGAAGETKTQLYDALGVENEEIQGEACALLLELLGRDEQDSKLYLANSVWTRQDLEMKEDYLAGLEGDFGAAHFSVDFADPATGQRMTSWVREQTRGLLEPEFDHDAATMEVLLNTIYFKDAWSTPFYPDATKEDDFTLPSGETVRASFMRRSEEQQAAFGGDYAAASLPFAGGGEMTFVVPWEGQTLAGLLETYGLAELLAPAEETTYIVEWSVPRFTVGGETDLIPLLEELGVADAFDSARADFSAACETPAYIGAVRQGTYLSVDEAGVEAAAYTEIAKDEAAAMPTTDMILQMHLDEPFLYAVRSGDGTLLFVGVCADPAEEG